MNVEPSYVGEPQVLYRMYDEGGHLLYVGITVHLPGRFDHHRHNKPWWQSIARIELQHFPDRASVEDAERTAVLTERPRYNVALVPVPKAVATSDRKPVRTTPQRVFAVDDELWHDCMAIAKARRQKLSEVLRAALVDYRAANLGLLMQIKDAAERDSS